MEATIKSFPDFVFSFLTVVTGIMFLVSLCSMFSHILRKTQEKISLLPFYCFVILLLPVIIYWALAFFSPLNKWFCVGIAFFGGCFISSFACLCFCSKFSER